MVEETKVTDEIFFHPIEALCVPDSELPKNVDPSKREKYLSPEDFYENFEMDIDEFS